MTLDSIDLRAVHHSGPGTAFTVSLAADSDGIFGGSPGTVLSVLAGPQPAALATYNYTDALSTQLMPNTPYWVITSLAAGLTEEFSLQSTESSAQAGLIGWDILDTIAFSANSGQSWSISGSIPMFQVNASAVPEPSTWAASGALALMAGFAWRRRKG